MKSILVAVVCLIVCAVCAALATEPGPSANWWGPPPGPQPIVRGTVANLSATNIAVQTEKGLRNFLVNDKTQVRVRGEKASIADVAVGDPVAVKFVLQKNSAPLARAVVVPKPCVKGKVISNDGSLIVLKGQVDEFRVAVGPDTKFRSHGYVGSAQDVKVGYHAEAAGQLQGNTVNADVVHFIPAVAKGAVVGSEGDIIVVKTIRQIIIKCLPVPGAVVHIKPRVGPNQKGTLADIKVGSAVNIGFHPAKDGPAQLLWVDVLTGI
jgi:hypothetical protein